MNTKQPRYKKPYPKNLLEILAFATLVAWVSPSLLAQTEKKPENTTEDETLTVLSPFEVESKKDTGYAASSSLAGSRLNTKLSEVAAPIQVVTAEFMKDTASTDLQHILIYQTSTEAAGIGGNFYGGSADDGSRRTQLLTNPNSGTRVRGLNNADQTRNFFPTSIAMDAYNTERVDISRGPNSILFGLGSPAGIINTTLKDPNMKKFGGEGQFRVGSYGSIREVLDVNLPLLKDKLAVRVIGLNDNEKYRQDFTFQHDKRLYGALRWQPVLADRVFTQIDVKGESGKIKANRPVPVTASDYISNWFTLLQHGLNVNPLTDNGAPVVNGVSRPDLSSYWAGAPGRDWWNDSPSTIFQNAGSSAIGNGRMDAYRQRDGTPWGGLSGVTNPNPHEEYPANKKLASYYDFNPAVAQIISQYNTSHPGKPFNGFDMSLWPVQSILSGPLAFVDQTMQGPNKREWNNFDTVNLELTQTYLEGRLGFNAAYDRQYYRNGYYNAINTNRVAIDVNATLRDGSANPDVGRPMIIGPSAGRVTTENREAYRGTGFYKFRISDYVGKDSVVSKILGEQTFTAVIASQHFANFSRSFDLYGWNAQSYAVTYENGSSYKSWWGTHYIGDSLMNVAKFSDIPGSAIHPITASQTPAGTSNTLVWDDNTKTWHMASLTLDSFENNVNKLYNGASQGFDDTKSKSFVWQGRLLNDSILPLFGWRKDAYTRWDKPSNLKRGTDGAIQPFSPDWSYLSTALNPQGVTPISAEAQRRSWGLVVNTGQILDLFHYKLPQNLNVSFFYNDSNSFRPSDVGTDVMGRKLDSPSGTTRDKGVLITALNERVSLRVTWYKTVQKNTTLSSGGPSTYWEKAGVARTMNALAMETWGANKTANLTPQATPERLVNQWMFGTNYDTTIANTPIPLNWQTVPGILNQPLRVRHAAVVGDPTYVAPGTRIPDSYFQTPQNPTATNVNNTPFLSPPLSDAELAYRKAWFDARTNAEWFRPLDPTWVAAEQFAKITGDDYRIWGEGPPSGQKLINDLVTKGVEYELTANPTPNLRMSFNLAKAEASRTNILPDWAPFIAANKDLWFDKYKAPGTPQDISTLNYWNITGFGQIRHWGGGTDAGNYQPEGDTFGGRMAQDVYGPYLNALAGDGQAVNELRKWRWNAVANYTFDRWFVKGLNVGGAVRWQDKAAIGYYPKYSEVAQAWVTDVTKPLWAPSETNYDAWIGYTRKLTKNLIWEIQLNVRDLFAKKTLIPIMANPDGTVAQVRIPSETTYYLTNTVRF